MAVMRMGNSHGLFISLHAHRRIKVETVPITCPTQVWEAPREKLRFSPRSQGEGKEFGDFRSVDGEGESGGGGASSNASHLAREF